MAIVAGIMAIVSRQAPVAMAGDPAGFAPPPPPSVPGGGSAVGGVWTGMPEAGATTPEAAGTTPEAPGTTPEANEPTPVTGDTMSDAESAMPEADVSKPPDAGLGDGRARAARRSTRHFLTCDPSRSRSERPIGA